MKRLIIIRGIPGSGKSTLARTIANAHSEFGDNMGEEIPICEADQFFTDKHGNYHYIPRLVPTAHEWCRRKCEIAMQRERPLIIVSNTSVDRGRLDPYIKLAEQYGYTIQYIITHTPGQKDIHNVPEEKVKEMEKRLLNSLIAEGL